MQIMEMNIGKRIFHAIYSLIFVIFATMMVSCIDEFNAEIGDSDTNIIVIEGNIMSDRECTFYLTHSIALNSNEWGSDAYILDAEVSIIGTDGTNVNCKLQSPQRCYTARLGKLSPDAKYSLVVKWDGATFTSEPATPLFAPEIESVTYSQNEMTDAVSIYVNDKPATSDKPVYVRWDFDETWEIQSHYRPHYFYDPLMDEVRPIRENEKKFKGWKKAVQTETMISNSSKYVNNQIRDFRLRFIPGSDDRWERLYCLDVKQYAMSRAQYEYELARRELSNEMGGMFAPLPSELYSNITCSDNKHRAIGFIGVCGAPTTYRIWIERGQVRYTDLLLLAVKVLDDEDTLSLPFHSIWERGYRIMDEEIPMGNWQWVSHYGVDVTSRGASLVKPDYWPN